MEQLSDPPALIPAPTDACDRDAWCAELNSWRDRLLTADLREAYRDKHFEWVENCLVCAKVMLFDREFYSEHSNSFRVRQYMARMKRDFGGLDALVLWQAYPRIGFDDRNQFDHYRLAPSLKNAVDELHGHGVRVFMAYNPWDTGTRREPIPDPEAIAACVNEFGFDGVFLDTLREGSAALRQALDIARSGVVMESELELSVDGLKDHHASWAQWFDDSQAPGILRNRWLQRGHMMHQIRRWDLDHSGELHSAWMNGTGLLVWENVFGSWNGWSYRDKAILRAMMSVRRRFHSMFREGKWEPLVPCSLDGVFASKWSHKGSVLWTLVNRGEKTVEGQALSESDDGLIRLFDVVRGQALDHCEIRIAPRSVGAILSIPRGEADDNLLQFMRERAAAHLDASTARAVPKIVRWPSSPTVRLADVPPKMVEVAKGEREVVSHFRARECGEYGWSKFENIAYPALHFKKEVKTNISNGRFAIDAQPVSSREYQEFLNCSDYRPKVNTCFLLHWVDGVPVKAELEKPVVYVDLDDARAYAKWCGKRLPTEFEWQIAVSEHSLPIGDVWNWTESEHFDGHTKFCILKGGCQPMIQGSEWYADSGPRPADWSAKYIHWCPGLDRSPSIGFRCAVDLTAF